MHRPLTLAALLTSTLSLASSPPAPEAPAPTEAQVSAEKAVRTSLLQPLAAKERERSRFSRARLPATARRIRVLDAEPKKDDKGQSFQAFAIDARHGWDDLEELEVQPKAAPEKAWRKDAIVGCVYAATGEVFVKKGEEYRHAAVLLGKKTAAAEKHICQPAAGELARR